MKKPIIIFLSISFIFAACFFASPFIAVYSIWNGIENNDSEKISRHVNFPALRQSLKGQVKTFQAGKADDDNPLASLFSAFSSKLSDTLVDSLITPKGIERLLETKSRLKKDSAEDKDKTDEQAGERSNSNSGEKNILSRTQFGFLSLSRFFVKIPSENPDKGEYEFVFTRTGMNWKLSEAIIPFDKIMQDLMKGIREEN